MMSDNGLTGMDVRTRAMVEDRLVEGEVVCAVSRIHPGIYWQSIAVAVIAILVCVFVAYQLVYVLGGTALLMALYALWRYKFYVLILTDRRIMARYGLLQVDVVDMRFDAIESMETEQMLPGFLMGYANLVVMGTGNRYITIPYVANAVDIRKKFNEIVLKR